MNTHAKTRRMTTLALLSAITVVLQLICTVIKFGPFSITLALTPIIIGAALYGWKTGAFLGFVFSLVVYITGLMGMDGGFILLMMEYSAVGTTVLCLLKGTAAGAVAGWVYAVLQKKNLTLASIIASIATPVTNTGIFALGMMSIFYGFLASGATDGQNPIAMLFLSWIGINFIVEFTVNLALGTVLTRIIEVYNAKFGKKA